MISEVMPALGTVDPARTKSDFLALVAEVHAALTASKSFGRRDARRLRRRAVPHQAGVGNAERLTVGLTVDLEQRLAAGRNHLGRSVTQRFEEVGLRERDDAARLPGTALRLDDVGRVAGLQLGSHIVAVRVIRLRLELDGDARLGLHVLLGQSLERALDVVGLGVGEGELRGAAAARAAPARA